MPLLRPKSHKGSNTILTHATARGPLGPRRRRRSHPHSLPVLPHSQPHRFATGFDTQPGKQGLWVREPDGSYMYHEWTYDQAAAEGYAEEDIFVVGRDGYYLTLEEARNALPEGGYMKDPSFVHGVYYVDDYNDEFQDYFVCAADGTQPEPFQEAQASEPIQ